MDIPTKCLESRKQITVKALIQYIDFEGKSDGESLLKIISQLRARNVIIYRGNNESIGTLKYIKKIDVAEMDFF